MNKSRNTLKILLIIVAILLVFQTTSAQEPLIQQQGQSRSTIGVGESVMLFAQGKDDTALDRAWIATDESGEWQEYTQWWSADWTYKKQIIIHHQFVEDDLEDFPVFLSISDPTFITAAQPDGDDFLFTDAGNTTRYAHEIDRYTSDTGTLEVWVNIPSLSASRDTIFYMYYGNPTCSNQQQPEGVWNDDYLMVHHFSGMSWEECIDSTDNQWDITDQGGNPEYHHEGIAGYAVDFDGNGDYLTASDFRLPIDSSYTGSAWVYARYDTSKRSIFEGDADNGISLSIWTNEQMKAIADTDESLSVCYSTTTLSYQAEWYHVCVRVDPSEDVMQLYVNGVLEGEDIIEGEIVAETQGLNIGTEEDQENEWMRGRIDELHLSSIARSPEWITTHYTMCANQDLFFTIGNGSPLTLQENTEWQWANITWSNPSIDDGSLVQWKIYFEDTQGYVRSSDVMSFSIADTNTPPAIPQQLVGPSTGYPEEDYLFSLDGAIDPEGDDISYLIDWGDGTDSGWTSYLSSGTGIELSHHWTTSGSYFLKAKVKDRYGKESGWSASSEIEIVDEPVSRVRILSPASVVEGSVFHVTITVDNFPVEFGQVSFHTSEAETNEQGMVAFTAPFVDHPTIFSIIATHPEYETAEISITVLHQQEEYEEYGWIYGTLTSLDDQLLANALICATSTQSTTIAKCDYSDGQGGYVLLLPAGEYTLDVSLEGYLSPSISSLMVRDNEALQYNIILEPVSIENEPISEDFGEYAIKYGILQGFIGGELIIPADTTHQARIYLDDLSLDIIDLSADGLHLTVSGSNSSNGTVIALRIDSPATLFSTPIERLSDLTVLYDGKAIDLANSSGSIFALQPGDEPQWAGLLTQKTYILIAVPSFSEHYITIEPLARIAEQVGGLSVLLSYMVLTICAATLFVSPRIIRILKRRRMFGKHR